MPAIDYTYFVVLGAVSATGRCYTVAEFSTNSATSAVNAGAAWCGRTVGELLDQQEGVEQRNAGTYTDRIVGYTIERYTEQEGTDEDWSINGGLRLAAA